jgi:integrase
MIYALYSMGYKGRMTVHGFRSLASSILNAHNFNADAIEKQLAHEEENRIRRAYNRANYFQLRVKIMDWWGDYLEHLYPEYIQSKQIKMVYHDK